jgi:hypothetical protein
VSRAPDNQIWVGEAKNLFLDEERKRLEEVNGEDTYSLVL